MTISQAGVDLIKEYESCKLEAYPDPAVGWGLPTIGWGHTGQLPWEGRFVQQGDTISQPEANEILRQDLEHFSSHVSSLLRQIVSQGKFDALVSFAFNVGIGALQGSTLLALVNQGSFTYAAQEFPKWCHAGRPPVVMQGLLRRRMAEQKLFMGGA